MEKNLSEKRSQGRGEQRCVRDKKLCLGGNTEVAQKSKIWVSRRDLCARHLMYLYPSQPPQGLWLQQGGERKSFATIHHICVEWCCQLIQDVWCLRSKRFKPLSRAFRQTLRLSVPCAMKHTCVIQAQRSKCIRKAVWHPETDFQLV